MSNKLGIDPRNPTDYLGLTMAAVPVVQGNRQPLPTDYRYPLWTEWRVKAPTTDGSEEGEFWKLILFSGGQAVWKKFGEPSTGPLITLSDTSGTEVESDEDGNIQIRAGTGISVTSDPANFRLDIALASSSACFSRLNADVDFIIPSGSGQGNIIGDASQGVSTTGDTAQDLEITVANATNATKGVASFNATDFTVASGAVSLISTLQFAWQEINASQNALVQNGYVTNSGSQVVLTLPATAAQFTTIKIVGKGSGGWRVAQNASQRIRVDGTDTTTGVGGYVESTSQFDTIELFCETANTRWIAVNSSGTLEVV